MEAAQKWASATGKTTLEQTEGGQYLDSVKLLDKANGLTGEQAADVWNVASQRFADGASGEAYVFKDGAKPFGQYGERTWWRIEQPAIDANANVTTPGHRRPARGDPRPGRAFLDHQVHRHAAHHPRETALSGAVRIDMRRHLLCQPSLPDFRQLHPELRTLFDTATREEAPALCDALASLANARPAARDALSLVSWLREFKCEVAATDDRPGPAAAEITITRITRDGAAFGKGPMQAIATDKFGGPIIHWGLQVADPIRR
jgi:hypothetical protein